jgi:hypothetical protein
MRAGFTVSDAEKETQVPDRLTETMVDKLKNPSTSSDLDFHEGVNQVLADVGMSAADSGGELLSMAKIPLFLAGFGLPRWQA